MGTSLWAVLLAPWRAVAVLGRDAGVRRAIWALLLVLLTAAVYASVSLPHEVDLRAGQVAPFTIKSARDMVDRPATERRQAAAASKVLPVYSTDARVTEQALAAFDGATAEITAERRDVLAQAPPPPTAKAAASTAAPPQAPAASGLAAAVAALRQNLSLAVPLPDADYQAALLSDPTALTDGVKAARAALSATMSAGVRDEAVSADRQALLAQVRGAAAGPAGLLDLLAHVAAGAVTANRQVDPEATAAARAQAAAEVTSVLIARGQVIVREGDRVTPDEIVNLRDAGLLHPGGTFGLLAGALLVAILLASLCWAFLAQFYARALRDEVTLILFGAILVAALAAVRFGLAISPFLAPIAWAAMLASAAFGPGVALFVGGVGALSAGILDHNLPVAVVAAAGSWTAVFTMRRHAVRADFIRAGVFSALASAAATALLAGLLFSQDLTSGTTLISLESPSGSLLRDVAASMVTGLLSAVLAIGTLPLVEAMGVLTPFRLLELANPGQPLLRRLMVEAPGTYHHSLMVANLSEAACQATGGDALLVRAGAYYHDIGKMKRPAFFVENQMGGDNPHDKLSPQLSAMVITSHVRDGVELARQARLPDELVAFIRTHHGTTLVRYFYHAARTAATGSEGARTGTAPTTVSEGDFRYDGPLPESRETAIVMLADGVEAAVRSQSQPTVERIEEVIRKIIADRLEDGQLEQAALTLRDVDTIRVTFRRILVGAYHARIEYPEALAAEVAGSNRGVTG